MPPAAFLHPQNAPKSLADGASPQTPVGEAYSTPRPIRGPTSKGRRRREGKGKVGKEMGGEGKDFGPSQCWKQIDATYSANCNSEKRNLI